MAITTYAQLQDAVAAWLDRTDLTARIPDFITLAEADINARFNHRAIESTSTLLPVVGSRYIPLPDGFREPLNMWLLWTGSAGAQEMRAVIPEALAITTVNSIPNAWCVDGSNIAFDCPCNDNGNYSFLFRWAGAVALSDSTTTNLILANYPNVYLFGALREAAPYLRDADAVAFWEGRYQDAIANARAKEFRDKALTTLSTEPSLLTTRKTDFNIYKGY